MSRRTRDLRACTVGELLLEVSRARRFSPTRPRVRLIARPEVHRAAADGARRQELATKLGSETVDVHNPLLDGALMSSLLRGARVGESGDYRNTEGAAAPFGSAACVTPTARDLT
jgi:hypothetical protein